MKFTEISGVYTVCALGVSTLFVQLTCPHESDNGYVDMLEGIHLPILPQLGLSFIGMWFVSSLYYLRKFLLLGIQEVISWLEQPDAEAEQPEQPDAEAEQPEQPDAETELPEQPHAEAELPEQPHAESEQPDAEAELPEQSDAESEQPDAEAEQQLEAGAEQNHELDPRHILTLHTLQELVNVTKGYLMMVQGAGFSEALNAARNLGVIDPEIVVEEYEEGVIRLGLRVEDAQHHLNGVLPQA